MTDSAHPGAVARAPKFIRVDPDAWYDLSEVARLLGVTRQALLNRRYEGRDVPVMVKGLGGRLYARGAEIDKFLERGGERPAKGKLNEAQVAEVRRLLAKGLTQKEIAQRFGVSPSTISSIARRRPDANVPRAQAQGTFTRLTKVEAPGPHRSTGVSS